MSVLPGIKILKNGVETSEQKPFQLADNIQVFPTHYTPTLEFDSWFTNDDQF